jgi:hypothetical protein
MKIAKICVVLAFIGHAVALRGTKEQRVLEAVEGDAVRKATDETNSPTETPSDSKPDKDTWEPTDSLVEPPVEPEPPVDAEIDLPVDFSGADGVTSVPTSNLTSMFSGADGTVLDIAAVQAGKAPFLDADGELYEDASATTLFEPNSNQLLYSHGVSKGKRGSKVSELVGRAWIAHNKYLTSCTNTLLSHRKKHQPSEQTLCAKAFVSDT